MADEESGGAVAGAAQGAAAGAAFGPWGALIGGVIGGAVGYFSGSEKKLARKYGALAQQQRRRQQQMQQALQRRDLIRQSRITRAQSVAAGASESGVTSSAVQGSTSSTAAQTQSALSYFDAQVDLDNLFQQYAKKAGKHAGNAAELDSLLASAGSLVTVGANAYGSLQRNPQPTGQSPGTVSYNQTAAVSGFAGNSAFQSFGSSLVLN